jgi:hypothetical protein
VNILNQNIEAPTNYDSDEFVNKFLAMVRNANWVLTPNIEVVAVFVASIRGRCLFPVIVAAGGRLSTMRVGLDASRNGQYSSGPFSPSRRATQ